MKSKPTKKQDLDLEQDDDDVEIEYSGPGIAAAKKSKVTVVAASAVLITLVLYFFFFKSADQSKENLEVVEVPKAASVAASETGKSPFEIEVPKEKPKEEAELLLKPATPDVPTLPELPKEAVAPEALNLTPEQDPNQQLLPTQQNQANQQAEQKPAQPPAAEVKKEEKKEDKKELNPRYSPIIVFSGGGAGPALGVGYDKNIVKLKEDPISALQKTQAAIVSSYIDDRIHTIAQGKLLTAVLETAINTEIPGSVRAVVSHDVYGESGNEVLIPRGSRLFGSYSSKVSRGQGRVEIGWTRLIRSDGVDLAISFNASDQFGRSGIAGEVDNKYSSVITNSMLTSILAVGGVAAAQKLLTNNSATTTTTNPTQGTTTTTGSATNQALYDVTKTIINTVGQIIGSSIDINPVIRVPQGARITVIVNADINVPSLSKK